MNVRNNMNKNYILKLLNNFKEKLLPLRIDNIEKASMEMDPNFLGTMIRYHAHLLDVSLKINPKETKYKNNKRKVLKDLFKEWDELNFQESEDIRWARSILHHSRKAIIKTDVSNSLERFKGKEKSYHSLLRTIKERRSIRLFQEKIPSKSDVMMILESGRWAPISCNRQCWKFIVARPFGKKKVLQRAPLAIYVAFDKRLYFNEKYTAAMDAAIALQNMLLATHSLGLGGCFIYLSEFDNQDKLKKYLLLPSYYYVYAAIIIGFPKEKATTPPRRSLDEIINFRVKYHV